MNNRYVSPATMKTFVLKSQTREPNQGEKTQIHVHISCVSLSQSHVSCNKVRKLLLLVSPAAFQSKSLEKKKMQQI